MLKILVPLLLIASAAYADVNCLLRDLELARFWDSKMNETLPYTYNHILSTGYFTTPSARMDPCGTIGFGVAEVPPYLLWNGRIQPFSHLEVSANYRVFRGVEDPGLSPYGFGDFADRGANFKWAIVTPEDSGNQLPGLAIGVEDFMGTKRFLNYFVVGTQVFYDYGLEGSFGWGAGRYTHGPSRGFFGALTWFPWVHCDSRWLQGLSLAAEYDPTNYAKDPHPDGTVSHSPINFGVKYTWREWLYLSASRIRADAFAFAGSVQYNWGSASGFIPKIQDPLPFRSPVDHEPLGCYRPESVMIQTINFALKEQGFLLTNAYLVEGHLWVSLINQRYWQEHVVRMRLQHLFASLLPDNVSGVTVVLESDALPCQQYVYPRALLERYANCRIGAFEFDLLTDRQEALPPCGPAREIFHRRLDPWRCRLAPRYETFFGSASGKFKYDVGVKGELEGFFPYNVYYDLQISMTVASTANNIGDFDIYNPSQLPNVLTDYIRYRQAGIFSTDRAYLQRSWNLHRGWFGRASLGYFQVNYAGLAGELLWYPARSNLAVGIEGAVLKKRSYNGLGFQSKLRQLEGTTPTFHSYGVLDQYFLNLYLDIPQISVAAQASAGQFLARDKGVLLTATRYFKSGLRITGWITFTNAHDLMHGERYFNRGIAVEMPLDLFYRCSSRRTWNYGVAAWLRDAGAFTTTGRNLFEILNRERRY